MSNAKNLFTPYEIDIVLKNSTKEAHRLLPHRSRATISQKRHVLLHGINRSTKKGRWSKDEIAAIREHYPHMDTKQLIKRHLPGRSVMQVIAKARYLKLQKAYSPPVVFEGEKAIVEQIIATARQRDLPVYKLDMLCGTGRYFQEGWRRWPLNVSAVARALQLLGGEFRAIFTGAFGAESRRLLSCLDRFYNQPLPSVKKVARGPKRTIKPEARRLVGKAKNNPAIIAAVDKIVPRGMADRDDICQTILLALHEGTLRPDQLQDRDRVRAIIRAVRKSSSEQSGYAISLDQPMRSGRSWHETLTVTL